MHLVPMVEAILTVNEILDLLVMVSHVKTLMNVIPSILAILMPFAANGSYSCQCKNGFDCSAVTCDDINECDQNPCDQNINCTNTISSFTCTCRQGFYTDGDDWFDINECFVDYQCSAHADCINTVGSYTCTCNTGINRNHRHL